LAELESDTGQRAFLSVVVGAAALCRPVGS